MSRSAYKKYSRAINVNQHFNFFKSLTRKYIFSYAVNSFITVKILRFSPLQINLAFNHKDKNSANSRRISGRRSGNVSAVRRVRLATSQSKEFLSGKWFLS